MSIKVPRGFIMQWDSDQQKYVPMLVKIREEDIVWNVTDEGDEYNGYDNFFEYLKKILQNFIDNITNTTNISWSIENPTTVLTALIPVILVDSEGNQIETEYLWRTRIDGYYNITMTTRIPVYTLFENGEDDHDDTTVISPKIILPFGVGINDGYTNSQITLDYSSTIDGITNTSVYSGRFYDTSGVEIYDSSDSLCEYFQVIAKNHIYGITASTLINEVSDPSLAYINIMITGKGQKETIAAGTYELNSSTIDSIDGLTTYNVESSDDNITLTDDAYISFVASASGTVSITSSKVASPVITEYDTDANATSALAIAISDNENTYITTVMSTIEGYTYVVSAPNSKTVTLAKLIITY